LSTSCESTKFNDDESDGWHVYKKAPPGTAPTALCTMTYSYIPPESCTAIVVANDVTSIGDNTFKSRGGLTVRSAHQFRMWSISLEWF
jgi:hypothetical protein